MAENRVQVQYIRKYLWCWYCLRWIKWSSTTHQVQDHHDLLHRPELQRRILLPAYGVNVHELASVDNKDRTRELSAHQLDYYGWNLSLMNLLDGHIQWKEEAGEAVPYCPYCHRSSLHQKKWDFLKNWIKYPLLLLGIGVSLWFLTILLGRDVSLWG